VARALKERAMKAQLDRAAVLVSEIRHYLAAHADPEQAARYARFFKEGYDAWGLMDGRHQFWNEKRSEWSERYRNLGLAGFLRAGEMLFSSGKYEEGGIAIKFAQGRLEDFDSQTFPALGRWFEAGLANWAHTDSLCGEVIAPLLETGRIGLDAIAAWRESKFKYQRRAVPVSMLGLLKKHPEIPPLIEFVRPLMTDGERVVQQGVGWFLRECWKADPRATGKFLLEWKDSAPRLILQYATEKMNAEERACFRAGKRR
jgi:3-methyladenine DNA glycosylase AlkD